MSYTETPPRTPESPEASAAFVTSRPEILSDDERKQFEAVVAANDYSEIPDDVYKTMLLNPWKDEEVVDLWADAREMLGRDEAARQQRASAEDSFSNHDLAGDLYKDLENGTLDYAEAKRLLERRHNDAMSVLNTKYTDAQARLDEINRKKTQPRPSPHPRTAARPMARPADGIVARPLAAVAVRNGSTVGPAAAAAAAKKETDQPAGLEDKNGKNGAPQAAATEPEASRAKRAKNAGRLGGLAAAAALRGRSAGGRVKREFRDKDTRYRAAAVAAGALAVLIGIGAAVASSHDLFSPSAANQATAAINNPGAAGAELRPPVATKTELRANTHMNTVSEAALNYMNQLNISLPANYDEAQRTIMNLSDRVLVYNGIAGRANQLPSGFMVELPDSQVYQGWVDQAKAAAHST